MPGKRGSAGGGELPGAGAARQRRRRRKVSCFSSIQLFLVSECALMLAQGTVGAYLVSAPLPAEPRTGGSCRERGAARRAEPRGSAAACVRVCVRVSDSSPAFPGLNDSAL